MVRTLVLGATGYIGLSTCLALRRNSHIVHGLARNASKASLLTQNEILPILGTLEDSAWLDAIKILNIDVVIDASGANEGSFKILESVKKVGEERLKRRGGKGPKLGFVYVSGTWVHGSTKGMRLNDLNPVDLQGDAGCPVPPPSLVSWRPKLENAVLDARGSLDVVVIRPACLYGRGSFIWSQWFGKLQEAADAKAKEVEVQCDAEATLSLVHVDDVASALTTAAEKISMVSGSSMYPVFDIVGSRESARLILEGVARAMGFEGVVRFVEPQDPFAVAMSTCARLDSTRARDLLGWESKRVFGMVDEIEIVTAAWQAHQKIA